MSQSDTDHNRVAISRESLKHLLSEAEHTVDAITDPAWNDLPESDTLTDTISDTHDILQNSHSDTVEVATDVLEILLSEAEQTVECIDDPEWHEAAEDDIKPAIEEAQTILYGEDGDV